MWTKMAANFQHSLRENHFEYARRYRDYKKARDRLSDEDIFHAQENINFARREYKTFKSTWGRNPDVDPRFELNLQRLFLLAKDSMRIVTERHEWQNHLDMMEYLKGPFQSDYDLENPLLTHPYIHDFANDLYWTESDTPDGPWYRPL